MSEMESYINERNEAWEEAKDIPFEAPKITLEGFPMLWLKVMVEYIPHLSFEALEEIRRREDENQGEIL